MPGRFTAGVRSRNHFRPIAVFVVIILFATAAIALQSVPAPVAAASGQTASFGAMPTPTPQKLVWASIVRGVEYVAIPVKAPDQPGDSIRVARIDPAAVLFRIYYQEGTRKTVQDWARERPGAVIIVNANFFRANGHAIGLVRIGDRILSQATDRPGSGYFQVTGEVPQISTLPDDHIKADQPSKHYIESFEGFPLLIMQGKPVSSSLGYDAAVRAWRTVIAQDDRGRILLIVTAPTELGLPELTNWLCSSGLGIVTALNLDGGSSSQMYIASRSIRSEFPPGTAPVPVPLVVYPR
jgi:exopolysaccharide biosynthesis protein